LDASRPRERARILQLCSPKGCRTRMSRRKLFISRRDGPEPRCRHILTKLEADHAHRTAGLAIALREAIID